MNSCNIELKYNSKNYITVITRIDAICAEYLNEFGNEALNVDILSGEEFLTGVAINAIIPKIFRVLKTSDHFSEESVRAICKAVEEDLKRPLTFLQTIDYTTFSPEWNCPTTENKSIFTDTTKTDFSNSENESEINTINTSLRARMIGQADLGNTVLDLWVKEFGEKIMERTVFGEIPKTGSFNASEGDTTYINNILFQLKSELVETLSRSFLPKGQSMSLYGVETSEEIQNIIESCLNQFYQSDTYTKSFDSSSREAIKTAYFLSSFDELLQLAAPYIGKTEFYKKNPDAVGKNMYVWIGPTVKHDVSWKNKEIIGIDHYTGSFIKMICEYLPEVNSKNEDKLEKISFAGFNNAMATLQDWIWSPGHGATDNTAHEQAIEEFKKKDKCDWGKVIDLYFRDKEKLNLDVDNILDNKLRGIRKYIFGTTKSNGKYKSIPEQFKRDFVQQIRNTVKTNYMVYRMQQRQDGKYELVGTPLKEAYYSTQQTTIRNRIAARIYYFTNDGKKEFEQILEKYKIEISDASNVTSIHFKGITNGSENLVVNIPHGNGIYELSESAATKEPKLIQWEYDDITVPAYSSFGNIIQNDYKDSFKDLLLDLGIVDNLDNADDILSAMTTLGADHRGSNLGKTFFAPLVLTLIGSSPKNILKHKKGDPNGYYQLYQYSSDLKTAAEYNAIAYGVEELTVLKDGNGNNLPGFQLGNQMEDIHYMIDDHIHPSKQGVRRGVHDGNTISDNLSVFKKNDLTKPNVIGRLFIRSDVKVADVVKKAAKLNVNEIVNIAILKDFVNPIFTPNWNGKIIHQSGTFADKTKHTCAEIDTNLIHISAKYTLAQALKLLTGVDLENNTDTNYGAKIMDHVREQRAAKLREQLSDIIFRFSKAFERGDLFYNTDDQIRKSMLEIRKILRTPDETTGKRITEKDLRSIFAHNYKYGIDLNENFDYVVWGDGSLDINPTLYHNMELYLSDSKDEFNRRIQAAMQADIATMIKEGVTWSEVVDSSFGDIAKRVQGVIEHQSRYGDYKDWFDPINGELKFCRAFDSKGNEISINAANVDKILSAKTKFMDSGIKVVYNPIYEAYFCCNAVIAPQMQDILLGDVAAYDVKATINKAKYFDFVAAFDAKNDAALDFFAQVEAEQSNAMSKRAMLLGATRYATKGKMKTAIMDDINAPTYNNSGIESDEKTADGAGYEDPIHAIRENNYLGAAATGMNKKSIYGYVDPQTGILRNLKWASFSITNTARRNFDPFCEMDQEIMFRKMTNLKIDDKHRASINFNDIYNLNPKDDENPIYSTPLYKYDNDADKYWKLEGFEQTLEGNWKANWQEVDKQGNNRGNFDSTYVDTTSLYSIDQSLGGAWMMYFDQNTNTLQYDDYLDSKILAALVDKFALDDYYIAYVVNKSAIKVGACNTNPSNIFTRENNDELTYFEMLQDYGGVQMDANHNIDLAEVTEMSQMVSSLTQRGLKLNVVDEIYSEIGQVALEAMDILLKANNKNNINDIFREIGKALFDTFESGNKDTIGLAQAFIRRAQAIIESKSKEEIRLPLSAETITPAYLNTIAALIRKRGIKRKFSGFPGVQVPSYGIMKTYNWTDSKGNTYTGLNFQELTELMAQNERGYHTGNYYKRYFSDMMLVPRIDNPIMGALLDHSNTKYIGYIEPLRQKFNEKWSAGGFSVPIIIDGENVATKENFAKYISEKIEEIYTDQKEKTGRSDLKINNMFIWDEGSGFNVDVYFTDPLYPHIRLQVRPNDFQNFLMNGGRARMEIRNPYIKKLKDSSQVDFEQTLVIVDTRTGKRQVRKVRGQKDYDEIRNLLDWSKFDVYDWTIQAKNLKGANTEITVSSEDSITGNNTIENYTIFDLDASRASYYLAEIQKCLKKGKPLDDIQYFDEKLKVINAACVDTNTPASWKDKDDTLKLTLDNIPELIKVCTVKLRHLCQDISEGSESTPAQQAFRTKGLKIGHRVIKTRYIAPQIIIGKTNAESLGLQKGDTLYKIKRQGVTYFERRLREQMPDVDVVLKKLEEKDIKNLEVNAIAKLRNGKTLIISKRRKDSNSLQSEQIVKSRHYETAKSGDDEKIWYDGNEFCKKGTKDFRTIDSLGYDIMYVNDLGEINDLNEENQIELIQYNFSNDNFKVETISTEREDGKVEFIEIEVPTEEFKEDLEQIATYDHSIANVLSSSKNKANKLNKAIIYDRLIKNKVDYKEQYIKRLAKRKYDAFLMQLRFIGARIPTQSMQSYADVEVVNLTDSNLNECYMARNITWIAGSDYDIDKFYCMGYELASDGHIITQSNLDRYFDPEWVLSLPNPDGKEFKLWYYYKDKNGTGVYDENGAPGYKIGYESYVKIQDDAYKIDSAELEACSNPYSGKEAKKRLIEKILKSGKHNILVDGSMREGRDAHIMAVIFGLEKHIPENTEALIVSDLNIHSKTKLGRKRKDAALKNKIVLQIHDVCSDIATQVDAQLPISMDEPKEAASKNTRANASKYFNQDQALMKFTLQYQNSLGKDGIGIVAVSMKAYFMALKSFNSQVQKIVQYVNQYKTLTTDAERDEMLKIIIESLDKLTFEGRNGDWLVFGNINFRQLMLALRAIFGNDAENWIINLGDTSKSYIIDSKFSKNPDVYANGKLNLFNLITKFDQKSNGEYYVPIIDIDEHGKERISGYKYKVVDVAMSLSALLSAATDNAKELILDTLNATPEFIDMYSIALTEGEEFNSIARLMTSETFNVLSRFSKGNMLNPAASNNFLNKVIDFVLDKDDLNECERGIFRLFIEQQSDDTLTKKLNVTLSDEDLEAFRFGTDLDKKIIANEIIKQIKANLLNDIKNNKTDYQQILLNLIANQYSVQKSEERGTSNAESIEDMPDDTEVPEDESEEPEEDDDDDSDIRRKFKVDRSYINKNNVKAQNWRTFYNYIKNTLIVKDQLVAKLPDSYERDLVSLQALIKKSEELKMLGTIGSINQGVKHTFAEEYRWVNRVQAFVNKRYTEAKGDFEPFDLIRFVDVNEVEYRQRQIDQYERVKSTVNILRAATETKNFNAMLNFVKLNRNLLERATINKASRILLDKLVNYDSNNKNGIDMGLTRSVSEGIIKTTRNYTRDLLIANWFAKTAKDAKLQFTIPVNNPINHENHDLKINFGDPSHCTENNVTLFLRWMDFYIIPTLRQIELQKDNPNKFLTSTQLDVRKNSQTGKIETKTVLSMEVNNVQNINDSRKYDELVSAFKKVANIKLADAIGDRNAGGNLTIAEAFFLYNLFVNKDGFGKNSWTRIFEDLITANMNFPLINSYYNYLYYLDSDKIKWNIKDPNTDRDLIDTDVIPYNINDLRCRIALINPEDAWKVGVTVQKEKNFADSKVKFDGRFIGRMPTIDPYHPFDFNAAQLPLPKRTESKINMIDGDSRPIVYVLDQILAKLNKGKSKDAPLKIQFVESSKLSKGVNGYYSRGIIYLNSSLSDKATTETFIHELGHFLAAYMRNSKNSEEYWKAIDFIIEHASKGKSDEKDVIQKMWSELQNTPEYGESGNIDTVLAEEILVRLLETRIGSPNFKNEFDEMNGNYINENHILDAIQGVLGLSDTADLTLSDLGLEGINSLTIEQILNLFNSAIEEYQAENELDAQIPVTGQKVKLVRQMLKEIIKVQEDEHWPDGKKIIKEFNC